MKKTITDILLFLFGAVLLLITYVAAFAQGAHSQLQQNAESVQNVSQHSETTAISSEYGVRINGVRWTTRNVCAPGTFTENPEDAGMFFQWNRRKGWYAIYPCEEIPVEGWDSSDAPGNVWERENNPCPPGWRVPNQFELQRLVEAGSEWRVINRQPGRLFGNYPYQIFLPAAGGRNDADGSLSPILMFGGIWGNTQNGSESAWGLTFGILGAGVAGNFWRAYGLSVRCVEDWLSHIGR